MTDEELAAIKARAEAATRGPWRGWVHATANGIPLYASITAESGATIGQFGGPISIVDVIPPDTDLEFIAHAREDVPALLAEVERLREIARAVGDGQTVCDPEQDVWMLLLANHTLSYVQTIWHNARALVGPAE